MGLSEIPDWLSDIAVRRTHEWRSLVTLLIGSRARGIHTVDSDFDLAFIVPDYTEPQLIEIEYDGMQVGLERYDATRFLEMSSVPLLDFKELREIGRLTLGVPLHCCWSEFTSVQRRWRHALLRPDCAYELILTAALDLHSIRIAEASCNEDRLWLIQCALAAIAMLSLNQTEVRFQKPKWLVHDLISTGKRRLTDLLISSQIPRAGQGYAGTAFALDSIEDQIRIGLSLRSDRDSSDEPSKTRMIFIHSTFRGARGQMDAGNLDDAMFAALSALRLVHEMVVASSVPPDPQVLLSWRRRAIQEALSPACLDAVFLDDLARSAREAANDVKREYGDLLSKARFDD